MNLSSWPNDIDDDAQSINSDESDVDFWGRVSPSRRATEAALREEDMEGGGSSEEGDDDDDDDENMSEDLEEEEVDYGDRMEIFGHR